MGINKKINRLKREIAQLEQSQKDPRKERGTTQARMTGEKEIKSLFKQKEDLAKKIATEKEGKKGFKKFLTKVKGGIAQGAINKNIHEVRREQRLQRQVRTVTAQEQIVSARARIRAQQKKNIIGMGELQGQGGLDTAPIRTISEKDIFG